MFERIIEKIRNFHRQESGAILLLSMASLLIIMMLSWVIIDAGKGARDKVELQAAADMSAYSHAAVKSRTMNMINYTNVGKRSVVGILSMYQGMYIGFAAWIAWMCGKCSIWNPVACWKCFINGLMMTFETIMDRRRLAGFPFFGGGSIDSYHTADVEALDNYQQYMMWLSPWWAYSEGLVRGMRNGATTVASFPPAPGQIVGITGILDAIKAALPSGISSFFSGAGIIDQYPVERMEWGNYYFDWSGDSLAANMKNDPAYLMEHLANSLHHKNRSDMGAATWRAYGLGMASFGLGYMFATNRLGDRARPYKYRRMSQANWLSSTSSLIFAYGVRPNAFGADRQKYNFIDHEYNHQFGAIDDFGYKSAGYWSLARSEMSYQSDELSPFYPSWTARLRPVALSSEWQEAGYSLNQAYHSVVPQMALTSVIGSGGAIMATAKDFANMERITRSFGHSTIEGIAK